jgi:exopolysaccharide biosynthesis polyprenyl glycosylphosphotransferase
MTSNELDDSPIPKAPSRPRLHPRVAGAVHIADFEANESVGRRTSYRLPMGERRLLLIAGDVLAAVLAAWIAFFLWHVVARQSITISPATLFSKLYWFPGVVGVWMSLAWLYDMYDPMTTANGRNTIQQMIAIWLSTLAIACVAYYFIPSYAPRTFVLLFLPTMSALVGIWRGTLAIFSYWLGGKYRVFVIGDTFAVTELASVMRRSNHRHFEIVAWASVADIARHYFENDGMRLVDLASTSAIDEVVVSTQLEKLDNELLRAIIECQALGVRVTSMPDVYRRVSRQIPVEYVDYDWVLHSLLDRPVFTRVQLGVKRSIDVLGSLLALPIAAIILPFAAMAVRLDSAGPVFYTQQRSGRGGVPFRIVKIRTMRTDAESDGVARWAGDNDPRITRVGRFLRKTRIDEIPQLWNVLRGDMSLVGPRPERPELEVGLEKQLPHYAIRHLVKPGVTGWAQIHYKYGNTREDSLRKLQYDFYYIRHWSLLLDVYVVLRTIGVVFGFKGQ